MRGLIIIGLIAVVCVIAALPAESNATQALLSADDQGKPLCPQMPVAIAPAPASIHLSPGLTEHESWLEFAVPSRFAGYYALCFMGRQIEGGGGELDFHTGTARFNIQTRLVNLHWLTHSFEALEDVQNWQLRLECDPTKSCA